MTKVNPLVIDSGKVKQNGIPDVGDLNNVDETGRTKNYVLKWNGTNWVPALYSASFVFDITSFSDGISATQEIGVGTWKAIGALTFTAVYANGPATDGYVVLAGAGAAWVSDLEMTNGYQGPTNNTETVEHRLSVGNITFTLHAANGAETDTAVETVTFYNRRHWGVSNQGSGYDSAFIGALASNELSNSKATTFTVTAGAGEYIIYSYPTRLGTATFYVGGFEGGFEPPETVSRTNDSGFVENYYVYRSTNSGLGLTTVTVV